jgi:hypothetical protein
VNKKMDHVTLLLVQILKQGEPQFKDVRPTDECGVFLTGPDERTPNRHVIHGEAKSPEDLPKRLKTDSELGFKRKYFLKHGALMTDLGEWPVFTEGDHLLMGEYSIGRYTDKPGGNREFVEIPRDVVNTHYTYRVLGSTSMTAEAYESWAATGFRKEELTSILEADPGEREKAVEVVNRLGTAHQYPAEGHSEKPAEEKTGFLHKLARLYEMARKPLAIGALVLAATAGVVAYKVQEGRERDRFGILSPDEESKLKLDLKSKIAPLLSKDKKYSFKDGNCEYDVFAGKDGVKVSVFDRTKGNVARFTIDPDGEVRKPLGFECRDAYERVGDVLDRVLKEKGK